MPYIFDTTANPDTVPAYGDKLSLGDISSTTNNASGDTKTTTIQQVLNHLEIVAKTASATSALTDNAKLITMSVVTTANTYTLQPNGTIPHPIGTCILVQQINTGVTSIVGGTGVVLQGGGVTQSAGQCPISNQYDLATCLKTGTDQWLIQGSVGAITA